MPRNIESYLAHHGILGQKWGIRRFQNKDGTRTEAGKKRETERSKDRILKKDATLRRISVNNPNGYSSNSVHGTSRVYASTNLADHIKWLKMLKEYGGPEDVLYDVRIKTLKDIRVADKTKLGEVWLQGIRVSDQFRNQVLSDLDMAYQKYGLNTDISDKQVTYDKFAKTLGYHTKSGDLFLSVMHDLGYDAISDVYGKNTAKDPLIILDPENTIRMTKIKKLGFR